MVLFVRVFLVFVVLFPFSNILNGQTTYTFVNTTGGSYNTSSNWSPAIVPPNSTNSRLVFNGGSYTVNQAGPNLLLGRIAFNGASNEVVTFQHNPITLGGTGEISVSSGLFKITNLVVENSVGQTMAKIGLGTLELTQPASIDFATVNVSQGELRQNSSTSFRTGCGLIVGASGVYRLMGGASQSIGDLSGSGVVLIGDSSSNFSRLTLGATADSNFSGAITTSNSGIFEVRSVGAPRTLRLFGTSGVSNSGDILVDNSNLVLDRSSGVIGVGGRVTLNSATVTALGTNQFDTSTELVAVAGTNQLSTVGFSQTFRRLQGNYSTLLQGSGTLTVNSPSNNDTLTILNWTGSGDFVRNGTGTYAVDANATGFSGTFRANSGHTVWNGMSGGGASIGVSATLDGSGSFALGSVVAGVLKGSHNMSAVTLQSSGTISPGIAVGKINTSSLVVDGGSDFNLEFKDANGVGGSPFGFDQIVVSGEVNFLSGQKINLNLWTRAPGAGLVNGPMANFDPTLYYEWAVISSSGLTGYDASRFNVFATPTNGTGGFQNSFAGVFGTRSNGNTMYVTYTPVPEPSFWGVFVVTGLLLSSLRRRNS